MVIVSEDTLLGTELLDGTKIVIDYAAHMLTISGEEVQMSSMPISPEIVSPQSPPAKQSAAAPSLN